VNLIKKTPAWFESVEHYNGNFMVLFVPAFIVLFFSGFFWCGTRCESAGVSFVYNVLWV
jgi:hypothetical protein